MHANVSIDLMIKIGSKNRTFFKFCQILKDLCYFWLKVAKYDFQKSNFSIVNFGLIKKVANETLVNLMVLNKFPLCYMGLRTIFQKITSKLP